MDLSAVSEAFLGPTALELTPDADGAIVIRLDAVPAAPEIQDAELDGLRALVDRWKKASSGATRAKDELLRLEGVATELAERELVECRPLEAERAALAAKQAEKRRELEAAEIATKGLAPRVWAEARALTSRGAPDLATWLAALSDRRKAIRAAIKGLEILLERAPQVPFDFVVDHFTGTFECVKREIQSAGVPMEPQGR